MALELLYAEIAHLLKSLDALPVNSHSRGSHACAGQLDLSL